METITINTEVLTRLTGMSLSELNAQLTNEETKDLLPTDEVSSKIHDLIGAKMSKVSDDQRKRGTRESLQAREREIASKYGVEKGKLDDMIASIVEKVKAETKESVSSEQSDSVQLMQTKLDALKAKLSEQKNEFTAKVQSFEQEKIMSKVISKGVESWMSLNPSLSDDESIKARQIDMFKQQLKSGSYKIDGDSIVVLDKDGNVKEDSNFNAVSFADHVAQNNFLPIKKQDNSNTKNPPRPSGGISSSGFSKEEVSDSNTFANTLARLNKEGNKEGAQKLMEARQAHVSNK